MSNKQAWSTPQLKRYGSVEQLTETPNYTVDVTKKSGSGDTITLTINGTTIGTIANNSGGSFGVKVK